MNKYHLPDGYKENTETKQYIDHDDGVIWQFGAYDLAFSMMNEVKSVIDIGCGGARKLRRFSMAGIPIIGYDANHPKELPWLDQRKIDLDKIEGEDLTAGAEFPSLIICADVIEHLLCPERLLVELIDLAIDGNIVMITTPDRELCHGSRHNGPPPNLAHAREWKGDELLSFIWDMIPLAYKEKLDLDLSFTQTTDKTTDKNTITIILKRNQ